MVTEVEVSDIVLSFLESVSHFRGLRTCSRRASSAPGGPSLAGLTSVVSGLCRTIRSWQAVTIVSSVGGSVVSIGH